MHKVSVIMSVYNGEPYIGESIASVLNQTLSDLELIVVNDGSTDNTLEIVQSYAKIDDRVKLISRANSGRPSFPRNDALAVACGDFICFLDHDDLYDADRTRQLLEGLQNHPEWVAAFHDVKYIDNKGVDLAYLYLANYNFLQRAGAYLSPIGDEWYECSEQFYVFQSLHTAAIHTSSILIAKNRLPEAYLSFDPQFAITDDTDLWIRLGLQGKIGFLNRVLSSYRQYPTSISRNQENLSADTSLLHKHNFQRIKNLLTPEQISQYRNKIAICDEGLARLLYLAYRPREARAKYRESLSWSVNWKRIEGYLKTYIPVSIVRYIKERQ